MLIVLTEECLDNWISDFSAFRGDFLRACTITSQAIGYSFKFNQSHLEIAHENWKAGVDRWEATYVMKDSNGLSHLKIMALLLVNLASIEWLEELYEFDAESVRDFEFSGSKNDLEETRKDLAAGRGTFLAFEFCIMVLNWFENARIDRVSNFEFRLTEDLRHDILVYLLSERRDDMAVFLMLKALYVRISKSSAP
ncbi:hypothetical protein [Aquabacter cavernae]|uniref:hypothetical protein n=1 Tax=Aquabacter cavernae TaxID=2496029 RepID=UPI000F8D79CE|nr:hypothetical protein [Aquabacter cavernae]